MTRRTTTDTPGYPLARCSTPGCDGRMAAHYGRCWFCRAGKSPRGSGGARRAKIVTLPLARLQHQEVHSSD